MPKQMPKNDAPATPIEDQDGWLSEDPNPPAGTLAKQRVREVQLKGNTGAVTLPVTDLRELSFDAILEAVGAVDISEANVDQYGPILDSDNKDRLLKVPFVIVHWEFHKSDEFGGEFVSAWVLTQTNERYILNDGSSGIYLQLRSLTDEKGIDSGLVCKRGLRVSVYDKELPNGNVIRDAKTYYIDTKL